MQPRLSTVTWQYCDSSRSTWTIVLLVGQACYDPWNQPLCSIHSHVDVMSSGCWKSHANTRSSTDCICSVVVWTVGHAHRHWLLVLTLLNHDINAVGHFFQELSFLLSPWFLFWWASDTACSHCDRHSVTSSLIVLLMCWCEFNVIQFYHFVCDWTTSPEPVVARPVKHTRWCSLHRHRVGTVLDSDNFRQWLWTSTGTMFNSLSYVLRTCRRYVIRLHPSQLASENFFKSCDVGSVFTLLNLLPLRFVNAADETTSWNCLSMSSVNNWASRLLDSLFDFMALEVLLAAGFRRLCSSSRPCLVWHMPL